MWRLSRRPALLPLLATALAVLLALLAWLQYRWLGQVSAGERQRLRATLEARARDFARDFDAEVTRAADAFRAPPTPGGHMDPAALSTRWEEWRATAPHPDLVRDVLFLQLDAREASLRRLDRRARAFVPAEWPPEVAAWREAHLSAGELAPASLQPLWAALEDLPVVLVSVPFVRVFARTGSVQGPAPSAQAGSPDVSGSVGLPGFPGGLPPASFLLVSLDLEQVRARLLPQLVSRYFSTEDVFDYRVSVTVRRDPSRVIFESDASAAASQAAAPDAVVPLFAVRAPEVGLFVPHAREVTGFVAAAPAGPGQPGGPGGERAAEATGLADRLAVSVIRLRDAAGEQVVTVEGGGGRWQLRLAHRAGSVDAAVARTRHRNLAVSSTVLLLLAASFGVMVIATRRAQRLAAQQVEFVAGVTHELRTPLAVIRSAGENLADGVVETPGEVRQYGALITGEGRKLGAMVERVMEYAGMQGSTGQGPRERVDVARVLEDAARAVRRLPAAQAARVEVEVPGNLPPIWGDGAALGRAVENLLENALKYGRPAEGEARVVARARAEGPAARRRVVIEVADEGPGVEAAERDAIFEPFVRGRAAVAARVPGTGLGLSLVRRIAEAHGGRVSLRRDTGPGACFAITLPAAPEGRAGSDVHVVTA